MHSFFGLPDFRAFVRPLGSKKNRTLIVRVLYGTTLITTEPDTDQISLSRLAPIRKVQDGANYNWEFRSGSGSIAIESGFVPSPLAHFANWYVLLCCPTTFISNYALYRTGRSPRHITGFDCTTMVPFDKVTPKAQLWKPFSKNSKHFLASCSSLFHLFLQDCSTYSNSVFFFNYLLKYSSGLWHSRYSHDIFWIKDATSCSV